MNQFALVLLPRFICPDVFATVAGDPGPTPEQLPHPKESPAVSERARWGWVQSQREILPF